MTSLPSVMFPHNIIEPTPNVHPITIEQPSAAEDVSWFFTEVALTVKQLNFVITGATSVTTTIRYATDRSAAGTEIVTGGTVANSTSNQAITSFNSDTIAAGSWVWVETTALSGTPSSVSVSITFW